MINAVGAAQSILLLGGTSEIGLAITAEFLKKGPAKVILASLPNDPLREASAEKMKAAGASEVVTLDFDATDFDSHPEVVEKAFADGDVDICIVAFGM
nr:SDR family NAD(P)-dependent oxidoreductase [Escherichia coli]